MNRIARIDRLSNFRDVHVGDQIIIRVRQPWNNHYPVIPVVAEVILITTEDQRQIKVIIQEKQPGFSEVASIDYDEILSFYKPEKEQNNGK